MTKRAYRSAAQWQQLVIAQEASGLTVPQFCKEHGLTPSNFYWHRKKCHSPHEGSVDQPTHPHHSPWLALNELVSVSQDERRWQIELKLPGGVVLNMSAE
jgi:hypothetical protein